METQCDELHGESPSREADSRLGIQEIFYRTPKLITAFMNLMHYPDTAEFTAQPYTQFHRNPFKNIVLLSTSRSPNGLFP